MKRPSFQFYPADWLNDIKLQTCSLGAQGLLVNLMCLMHQSDRYGYLLINNLVPDDKTVAKLLRLHHKTYHTRLIELLLYGVLCRDEKGVIFCKRMIKDEYIRDIRRVAGKLGGSPLLKQKVKQGLKQKTTPSSSSSSSPSKKEIYVLHHGDEKVLLKDGVKEVLEVLNEERERILGKKVSPITSDAIIIARLKEKGKSVHMACRIIMVKAEDKYFKDNMKFFHPDTLFQAKKWKKYLDDAELERT